MSPMNYRKYRLGAESVRALIVGYCLNWSLLLIMVSSCYAKEIVVIYGSQSRLVEENQIRALADFYGLEVKSVDVGSKGAAERIISLMKSPTTLAVLTSVGALQDLDRRRILGALRRREGKSIPMLVFGVEAGKDGSELERWSGGAVHNCTALPRGYRPTTLQIKKVEALSRMLSGMELPAVASPTCDMRLDAAYGVQNVLSLRDGRTDVAVLVRSQTEGAELFFTQQLVQFDLSWRGDPQGLPKAFSSAAPFIFFLSYAAGDYRWHLDGHYANLTIDDAWLTQPYGRLDYAALLTEMQRHTFHTTIAFIPWNYDRSKPDVVSLFQLHPEEFSVCIHGNDHDHREFGTYARNSLTDQIARIKQSVARMERFHALTNVPYDRFMVFPQGVAPQETFAALKTYGFLGTANSLNVPLGVSFPDEFTFVLRPYTVKYSDLLSLSRYPASGEIPVPQIAIHSFLGNPLLFYGHEDLFQKGIDAFDGFADAVHKVQPDTHWASLGEIARHSHLIRRREDGGFDVRMLSSEMDLSNPTERDAAFYIRKEENSTGAIGTVTIDGSPAEFEQARDILTMRLVIPARQVRKLRIAYQSDLDLVRQDISKRSAYVYTLRRMSDLRDLQLSRSTWGNAIVRTYYRRNWNSIELRLEQKWWVVVACAMLVAAGRWYHLRKARVRVPRKSAVN